MSSANHANRSAEIEFVRDPSPPNQFPNTFEDRIEEDMTSVNDASQSSDMGFGGGGTSPPNQFRYTFAYELEEETTSAKHANQT